MPGRISSAAISRPLRVSQGRIHCRSGSPPAAALAAQDGDHQSQRRRGAAAVGDPDRLERSRRSRTRCSSSRHPRATKIDIVPRKTKKERHHDGYHSERCRRQRGRSSFWPALRWLPLLMPRVAAVGAVVEAEVEAVEVARAHRAAERQVGGLVPGVERKRADCPGQRAGEQHQGRRAYQQRPQHQRQQRQRSPNVNERERQQQSLQQRLRQRLSPEGRPLRPAVGAAVAVTSAVVGSMVRTVPPGCARSKTVGIVDQHVHLDAPRVGNPSW